MAFGMQISTTNGLLDVANIRACRRVSMTVIPTTYHTYTSYGFNGQLSVPSGITKQNSVLQIEPLDSKPTPRWIEWTGNVVKWSAENASSYSTRFRVSFWRFG